MENFDIENSVNPLLVEGALIKHENETWKVINMTKTEIFIENEKSETKIINDTEWKEIKLNDEWLAKFGFKIGSTILNKETNVNWIIKTTGNHFYITIKNDIYPSDNPVIGIKFVHDLQGWFYRLTKNTLIY